MCFVDLPIEFRRFVGITRESQLEWQSTVAEAQRLQRELDKMQRKFEECLKERSDFETKLCHARRLLESESKARRQLVCFYIKCFKKLSFELHHFCRKRNY